VKGNGDSESFNKLRAYKIMLKHKAINLVVYRFVSCSFRRKFLPIQGTSILKFIIFYY
jgi:hypothetical protein